VAEIHLTTGHIALVDDLDYDRVRQYRWGYYEFDWGCWFVVRTTVPHVRLHRFILDAPRGLPVDHWNHNTLDNRRQNLTVVTNRMNSENRRGAQRNSKTGIRGVHPYRNKYCVKVRNHAVGYFRDLAEAERAAIDARQRLMGHTRT